MSTQVDTRYGSVGGQDDDGLVVFRGVPFAAPPIGPRRFRAPEPAEPWNGVRPALRFSLPGPQLDDMPLHGFDISRTSEDCLYLNVWTPNTDGARTVMVWIHGGAFAVGSSSQPLFDGATLARHGDVVVVSINYRLGALGFLNVDADGFDANCGLLDLVAALEWVRDNIAGFGGDPTRVTVFGESAGAMSIGCLLGSPRTAGLFGRAILQSGSVGRIPSADDAAEVADRFLAKLDIDRCRLDGLRAVPVDDILTAQRQVRDEFRAPRPLTMPFQPLVDGELLPRSPLQHIADG